MDGEAVEPWSRSLELRCNAFPVHRCSYSWTWDAASSELSHAQIECTGSFDDSTTQYAASAMVDVDGARSRKHRRGTAQSTLSFFTDDFPGTHAWAFMSTRRADGEVLQEPRVSQFDDFVDTDTASTGDVGPGAMGVAMSALRELVCEVVGHTDCAADWDASELAPVHVAAR